MGLRRLPMLKMALVLFLVLVVCQRQASAASIAACGNLSADTYYLLTANVSSNNSCFNATAANITLDCQGYSVSYAVNFSGYGVDANGFSNITVKNCVFTQSNLTSPSSSGVSLGGSSGCLVENNSFITVASGSTAVSMGLGSNNVVNGNWVNTSNATGFSVSDSGPNNTFSNNTIITSNIQHRGIYFTGSSSNRILNNTIINSGDSSGGIWFESSSNNVITNNTISTSGVTGIAFHGNAGSNNNVLDGNNITTTGAVGYGIHFFSNCFNTTLRNNVINTSGNTGFGIEFGGNSNNVTASNNTITTSGSNAFGVSIADSSNINFTSLNVSTSGVNSPAFTITGSVNASVVDSTLRAALYRDAYFSSLSSGIVNFLNVSFSKANVLFSNFSTSLLNVSWYVDVRVVNSTGDPIDSASVNATDVNASNVFYGLTNSTGWVSRQNVSEYLQNVSGIFNRTPHTFTVSKTGYLNTSSQIPVTENKVITLVLGGACGGLISPNSVYTLTQNASSSGTCFTILANNITLDCQGNWINYSGTSIGYGINITGFNSTTIKNCVINQSNPNIASSPGILISQSNNTVIYNNSINTSGSGSAGINENLGFGYGNITGNTIYTFNQSGVGILISTSNNTVRSNTVITSGASAFGLSIGGEYNTIDGNNITTSASLGIDSSLSYGAIINNKISTSGIGTLSYGIWLSFSTNTTIRDNAINSSNFPLYIIQSNYTNVSYNNITTFCYQCHGVLFDTCSGSITQNNVVNVSGGASIGIDFDVGDSYGTAVNNTIIVSNANSSGIRVAFGLANSLSGNVITTSGYADSGISIYGYSNQTTVDGNIITASGNDSTGIILFNSKNKPSGFNNILSHNSITTSGDNASGIVVESGNDTTLTGNILFINGNNSFGVFLNYSNNSVLLNEVIRLNLQNNNNASIGVKESDNTTIRASSVWSNTSYAFLVLGASNTKIFDSTINSSLNSDFYFDSSSSGNTNATNVTFNKSDTGFGAGSTGLLNVFWYTNVHVVDSSNAGVASATVNATNVNDSLVFSTLTDSNGWIPQQVVQEYFQNISSVGNFTPHLISAHKNPTNSTSAQVTQNTNVVIVLNVTSTPLVISNVHVIDVTQNTVTIGWDTNRAANETLDYGLTTTYGSTYSNAALAATHSAYINGLTKGTTYHYRIAGCDSLNNCAQTGDYTFDTPDDSGGGGGGGTPTPVATVLPSPEASPSATATVVPSSAPGGSPSPRPAVEKDTVCVAGAVSELEIKRIVTVFEADAALHTLVELIVTNKGSRVLEGVRVSDEIPLALIPSVRFFNAPSSFSGGNATWLAGTLAPGESKSFAYLLPGRVSAGEFKKPVAYGSQLSVSGGLQLFALLIALVILAALVVFILKKRKR